MAERVAVTADRPAQIGRVVGIVCCGVLAALAAAIGLFAFWAAFLYFPAAFAFGFAAWALAKRARYGPALATALSAVVGLWAAAAFSAGRNREVWQDQSSIHWVGPLVVAVIAFAGTAGAGIVWWSARRNSTAS